MLMVPFSKKSFPAFCVKSVGSTAPLEKCCEIRKLDSKLYHARVDVVFNGAFGGVGDEEVVVGEGVVVTSSSLDMLTNSCLGRIMVSLNFLEGLKEEALEEFMVEVFEENDKMSKKYGLFN
nr:hypothetical protein [Tanacetum cinerariifolium]